MKTDLHPFSQGLLRWFDTHGRSLPWRDTADPYHIWISEIILQQTRVAQGYDYYLRFVERFPTVEALAAAHQDEVMQQWEGLGYYSRARNLHHAAQQIVAQGQFPTTYADIRTLKGVGDYTAAAIASFAFGLPHAVVDGNVYRVLSRFFGIATPIDSTAGKKEFAALAQLLLPAQRAADYNQAIMDFGALQCTPKSPDCPHCPMSESCQALAEGSVAQLPIKAKRIAITDRFLVCIFLTTARSAAPAEASLFSSATATTTATPATAKSPTRTATQIWVRRRPTGDIWAGLYEGLTLEFDHAPTPSELFAAAPLAQLLALPSAQLCTLSLGLRHQLTHRRLHADAYELRLSEADCAAAQSLLPEHRAQPLSQLDELPFPKLLLTQLAQLKQSAD